MTRLTTLTTTAAALLLLGTPAVYGDVLSDWNEILLTTTSAHNPFAQARYAAITQLAVFEAVNAVSSEYERYLESTSPRPAASAEAAAVAAAHRVLLNYFPTAAVTLDAARVRSLAALPDDAKRAAGIEAGEQAAAAMIARRANDGANSPVPYTPGFGPGAWQPTPPANAPAILLHWARLTPFGLRTADQFRSNPPPRLTSRTYERDYDELVKVGGVSSTARPADRTEVAQFFNAAGAATVWNSLARQLAANFPQSFTARARMFALLNMAISDGLVSSMETKYFYQFWRPVTAIRNAAMDGNPDTRQDAAFLPLIVTPAFPSYPSAHASGSYAARELLERVYGERRERMTLTHPALPAVTLRYIDLEQVTDDVDDARIYGGIHFRFDQEAGARQGRRVGAYIFRTALRPVNP